ncbi:NADPH-dependent FMN reductase [Companilactobacillus mishanensis]|uniref:NAD(P)H-dependent oxidoreductase n=1 Tax=Companilactobacillus mishanensis TaxID=2486008 RepID=A0A5P0ZHB9_9LACO|nr:NADPH-dependent FMN reductase [Companilactobacillus mishanensis]MQS52456.1 NAD(P)H-dependent oxidoreductase [Companilactobacillus mishanensis]
MKSIGLIIGSNRPNRIAIKIAKWIDENFDSSSLELEMIDLKKINLPFLDEPEIPAKGNYQQGHTIKWAKEINSLDGIIILYPQYNWGYPAVLKNALDYLYDEWRGKPVSTIVYGSHGGFQAQIALDLVLKGLHMNTLNSNISLSINTDAFNVDTDLEKYRFNLEAVTHEFENILN